MVAVEFRIDEFARSEDPWQYILDSGIMELPSESVRRELANLKDRLDDLDEYHLAFALPIAERHAPAAFAGPARRLLDHESLSVRINAQRVLDAANH
jgi:hypothetical protein